MGQQRHRGGWPGLVCALGGGLLAAAAGPASALAEPGAPWSATVQAPDAASPQIEGVRAAGVHRQPKTGPGGAGAVVSNRALVEGDGARTTFRLSLSKGVTAEVYSLANPYRVIVDLPDVTFEMPAATGRASRGLVRGFRYGLFAEGKARIVLDMTGPVRIEKAGMVALPAGNGVELAVEVVPSAAAEFGAGTGGARAAKDSDTPAEAHPGAPKRSGRPIVLIDPGHGGIDGGAVSGGNLIEKNVVLAVARELLGALQERGRYDVRTTRDSDVFVSLDRRLKISRDLGADLFISLHADSLSESQAAAHIRGATVYTLSDRASDEEARRMAEKENASDALAGIDIAESERDSEVRGILIDLMKRETANFSADFSKSLVSRLGKKIALSRDPLRSAAFKVLKQTNAPSVLVELGYMSHPEDQRLLGTPAWQKGAAGAIAEAVDLYFEKRTARVP